MGPPKSRQPLFDPFVTVPAFFPPYLLLSFLFSSFLSLSLSLSLFIFIAFSFSSSTRKVLATNWPIQWILLNDPLRFTLVQFLSPSLYLIFISLSLSLSLSHSHSHSLSILSLQRLTKRLHGRFKI